MQCSQLNYITSFINKITTDKHQVYFRSMWRKNQQCVYIDNWNENNSETNNGVFPIYVKIFLYQSRVLLLCYVQNFLYKHCILFEYNIFPQVQKTTERFHLQIYDKLKKATYGKILASKLPEDFTYELKDNKYHDIYQFRGVIAVYGISANYGSPFCAIPQQCEFWLKQDSNELVWKHRWSY